MRKFRPLLLAILGAALIGLSPAPVKAEDAIEKAGVGVGVTAGNLLLLPIKAISVTIGALSGALSFVVTGGDTEVTRQVWQDTAQGPYAITPEVAHTAIGYRPEILAVK
jgi:hypothetical protein